jgi:surfeit locus 1 family protein
MQTHFSTQHLFSRHWWLILVATTCMTVLTVRLGFWQLGRAQQKEATYQLEMANADLPALGVKEFLSASPLAEANLQRRIEVNGQWLNQWTIFLENRTMQGKPGFWVFTPLQIAPGKALLVQRGWVARDLVYSDKLPAIDTPNGDVEVQGRWVPPPSVMYELTNKPDNLTAPRGFSTLRQNIDVKLLSDETGLELLASVRQTGAPSEGLQRDWSSSLSGSDKNRAYALQWFALAALCAGLFAWFQIIQKIRHDAR